MEHEIIIGGTAPQNVNNGLGEGLLSQPQPIDPMKDGEPIGQAGVNIGGIGTGAEETVSPPLDLEPVGELRAKGGINLVIVIGLAALGIALVTFVARMADSDG